MIRVLLADDQAMFRRALSSYIEITTDFEVVAEASNADQALRLIHHHQPDVALLDIQMPGDGLTVAEEVA
ncbi:response regulator transcription factor [Auritidibacter ignavus]|uniref:response regulator transcription factor n=1 Tax=Auritidibacter ignavus TaxID=678932 RepID=UPI00244CABD6|nr:response regulator transcription factor [Auritidibacter ignavus]WGH83223.1 response regulator transcription factor [Auritidibacter ignavus]